MMSYISDRARRYASILKRTAERRNKVRYVPGGPLPPEFIAASTRLMEEFKAYKVLREAELPLMSHALNNDDTEGAESRYLRLRKAFGKLVESYRQADIIGVRYRMPEEMMKGIRNIECTYEFMSDPSYYNAIMVLIEGQKKEKREKRETRQEGKDERLKSA